MVAVEREVGELEVLGIQLGSLRRYMSKKPLPRTLVPERPVSFLLHFFGLQLDPHPVFVLASFLLPQPHTIDGEVERNPISLQRLGVKSRGEI